MFFNILGTWELPGGKGPFFTRIRDFLSSFIFILLGNLEFGESFSDCAKRIYLFI